ncbi:hypothetical protein LOD99_8154 [Oopsacas minuta]|uniref:Uncharacterized protein n=1 Tax=Oopsacas minuta TaxID=111878 RepID=A0AAV7JI77_9METZ|nr:hypothetical protein LOD99_8154 [Oopsacas minuta]
MKIFNIYQLILYICIIYSAECRTIRRQTNTDLIITSSETINNCEVGDYEAAFGADFQVRENSNVTLLISINRNHPSLIGESMTLSFFKDNTNIQLVFPNSVQRYPVEAMLTPPNEPEITNLFVVYEFGLVIVGLKLKSGQSSNNGEYKIEVGTLNTPVLTTVTSIIEFTTSCPAEPIREIINTDENETVFEEIGSYTHNFGGSIHVPTGSVVFLRISYDENHPDFEGEAVEVTLYKDGTLLRPVLGFISEGEFELEPDTRDMYPNIFVKFDFGYVYNSLVIRNGNPDYNGQYTLTICTRSRTGIASATTRVLFAPESTLPPALKRTNKEIFVYNKDIAYIQGIIGDRFIVLTPSSLNSIILFAEDTNNNNNINWNWYFTPIGGNRELIRRSQDTKILKFENSSALLLDGNEERLGVYTVEATNSAGFDVVSSEINNIMTPMVSLPEGRNTVGAIKIGVHVDISTPGNERVVIEARYQSGFPSTITNWFYSKCRDGERKQIENSDDMEIITDSTITRLIIRNTTRIEFGYYFAMASNLAGVEEAYSILGKAPELEEVRTFHNVEGFTQGQIGDSFKLSKNSLISIEANAQGFPPVSFSWFKVNPLDLYTEERRAVNGEDVRIGNTLNKSVFTLFTYPSCNFIKYTVRVSNELGQVELSSYVLNSL